MVCKMEDCYADPYDTLAKMAESASRDRENSIYRAFGAIFRGTLCGQESRGAHLMRINLIDVGRQEILT